MEMFNAIAHVGTWVVRKSGKMVQEEYVFPLSCVLILKPSLPPQAREVT